MKDYLNDLYARLGGQMKLGLGRTQQFMAWMEHPENAFSSIHVAGTNGKGSVVALAETILRHTGFQTGRFTSPHLTHFNERIRINGEPVPEENIEALITDWRPWLDTHEISFFEITTGLAFYLFREHKVNAAVIETGLGGRLDSTNVLTPAVVVITSVNKDHTRILGDSLALIAAEKAGIFKERVPVITCPQAPEVMTVLRNKAKEKNAPFYVISPDDYFAGFRLQPSGMSLHMKNTGKWIQTSLAGIHQLENSALAIKACDIFSKGKLTQQAICDGLRSVQWKGRFEMLYKNPPIYYDVAHNPSGVQRLKELVLSIYPGKKLTLVIGMLGDKETHEIVDIMLPHAGHCFLTPVNSHRSMGREDLALLAASRPSAQVALSVPDAIKKAKNATPEDGLILVYGSHYMAPDVYQSIRELSPRECQ
jgi:dihydrofolate synthase / folylpolyglutamate synthase